MLATPQSPVFLEAASLLLDRAAHSQFAQFLAALRAEREKAVRVMLTCLTSETVMTARGVTLAYDDLIHRMEKAEEKLAAYEAAQAKKERAR